MFYFSGAVMVASIKPYADELALGDGRMLIGGEWGAAENGAARSHPHPAAGGARAARGVRRGTVAARPGRRARPGAARDRRPRAGARRRAARAPGARQQRPAE